MEIFLWALFAVVVNIWGVVGVCVLSKIFKENPHYDITPQGIFKAGPYVWIIGVCISTYNFIFCRR